MATSGNGDRAAKRSSALGPGLPTWCFHEGNRQAGVVTEGLYVEPGTCEERQTMAVHHPVVPRLDYDSILAAKLALLPIDNCYGADKIPFETLRLRRLHQAPV